MPDQSREPRFFMRASFASSIPAFAGAPAPVLVVAMLMGAGLGLGGCQKTALRADDMRSQFDRYDQARNQRAQPFLEDEFGRRTPNLSERLLVEGE